MKPLIHCKKFMRLIAIEIINSQGLYIFQCLKCGEIKEEIEMNLIKEKKE